MNRLPTVSVGVAGPGFFQNIFQHVFNGGRPLDLSWATNVFLGSGILVNFAYSPSTGQVWVQNPYRVGPWKLVRTTVPNLSALDQFYIPSLGWLRHDHAGQYYQFVPNEGVYRPISRADITSRMHEPFARGPWPSWASAVPYTPQNVAAR